MTLTLELSIFSHYLWDRSYINNCDILDAFQMSWIVTGKHMLLNRIISSGVSKVSERFLVVLCLYHCVSLLLNGIILYHCVSLLLNGIILYHCVSLLLNGIMSVSLCVIIVNGIMSVSLCVIIIFPRNVVFGDIMFSTATQPPPHRRRRPPHHRIISLLAR